MTRQNIHTECACLTYTVYTKLQYQLSVTKFEVQIEMSQQMLDGLLLNLMQTLMFRSKWKTTVGFNANPPKLPSRVAGLG